MRILTGVLLVLLASHSWAEKTLTTLGINVSSLANPYFKSLVKGAEIQARAINPQVRIITQSNEYDQVRQNAQLKQLVSAGAQVILVVSVDTQAVKAAIDEARAQGIVVVGVDVDSAGADLIVQTDNVLAGEMACDALASRLKGRGKVVIQNGPQVSSVKDRVNGCRKRLATYPRINLLNDDQDGKASRWGGSSLMQMYDRNYPELDGVFAINDPQAIGTDQMARSLKRKLVITSVDGSPDVEVAMREKGTLISASSTQNPKKMAEVAVEEGVKILNGKPPASRMMLMKPSLLTQENLAQYKGWGQ